MKTLKLNDQTQIPILGFGTWRLQGDECRQSVTKALEVGYRHIDTADRYGNHKEVGEAITDSGIAREKLFITTKVWRDSLKKQDIIKKAKQFLQELSLEYLDLLLIHWPNKDIPIQESLEGLQSLQHDGLIKTFGVSNFTRKHLEEALQTDIDISINQVEFHPSLHQAELKQFCDDHNIVITAYSPLAQGQDLKLALVQELSQKYNRSTSQIVLNWLISKDIVAIPRSSNPERIADNFQATEWELAKEDIMQLDQLNTNNRIVNPHFSEFNK